MLFETHEAREAYFARVEADLDAVEYGDALRHAEGTQLGFFGDEDDLFDDCSRIMLAEVRKYAQRRFCRLVDVQHCLIWHALYQSARVKPGKSLAAVYRDLANNTGNQALIEEAEKLERGRRFFSDHPPYSMVYQEIQKKGVMP